MKNFLVLIACILSLGFVFNSGHVIAQNVLNQVVTPSAPSGSLTLTTGATSQSLWAANTVQHGAIILNPLSTTQEGIGSVESVWVNITSATATATAGGQNYELVPGATLIVPYGDSSAASWIATTISHKITVIVY